jgi:cytochrome b561
MPSQRNFSIRPTAGSYTRAAVLVHWLLAAALLAQVMLGWWMLDLPKSPPGLRAGWFNVHKSIGLTIALIAFARIAWRTWRPVSENTAIPPWQRHASRINHALLYLCMLVLPVSGLAGSNFTVHPVLYFGLRLPGWNHDWPAAKHLMSSVHASAVWLLMTLTVLHVAAALWHWVKRDNVCARMGLPPPPTFSRSWTR